MIDDGDDQQPDRDDDLEAKLARHLDELQPPKASETQAKDPADADTDVDGGDVDGEDDLADDLDADLDAELDEDDADIVRLLLMEGERREAEESLAVETLLAPNSGGARVTSGNAIPFESIGDYEILSEIARGGMGAVLKARHVKLDRTVALKMMLAGPFATKEEKQRFRVEAEAAAQLDHPYIVPVFDVGEFHSQPYFTMGFIDGESLGDKVQRGPLQAVEAATTARKIAEATAYAHDRGVLHRDIKPLNVLIDQSGNPRLTDFGLARRTNTDTDLTGTGQVLGTPSFMSPEQALGQVDRLSPAADIYSIGATLYCMLIGQPPFQAASVVDTLRLVAENEAPSPRRLNPLIPKDLAVICLKCLRKEPESRYESAAALAADLQRFLDGRPIAARPVSRTERIIKWTRRRPAVAALSVACVLILIVAGVGGYWYQGNLAKAKATEARQRINALVNQVAVEVENREPGFGDRVFGLLDEATTLPQSPEQTERLRELAVQSLGDPAFRTPQRFENLSAEPYAADVTPDGRYLIVGLQTGRIVIVDLASNRIVQRIDELKSGVSTLKATSNGRFVTTSSICREPTVWSLNPSGEWALVERIDLNCPDGLLDLRLSPDSRWAIGVGPIAGEVERVDTYPWAELITGLKFKLPVGEKEVYFHFRPVRGLHEGGLKEGNENAVDNTPIKMPLASDQLRTRARFAASDRYIVSIRESDNAVFIYDRKDPTSVVKVPHQLGSVGRLGVSNDNQVVVLSGPAGVAVHDVSGKEILFADELGGFRLFQIVGPHNDLLLKNQQNEFVRFSVRERRILRTLMTTNYACQYSSTGRHWICFDSDNSVVVGDESSTDRYRFSVDRQLAYFLEFSPDSSVLVTRGQDRGFRFWESPSGRPIAGSVDGQFAAFHPAGDVLAVARANEILLHRLRDGKQLGQVSLDVAPIALHFSPDGRFLIADSVQGRSKLWEIIRASNDQGTLDFREIAEFKGGIGTDHWSPDSKRLAWQDLDNRIQVIDFEDPQQSFKIDEPYEMARLHSLCFLTRDRLLYGELTPHLWEGGPVDDSRLPRRLVAPFSVSPNGRFIACREDVYETATWRRLFRLPIPSGTVHHSRWSPCGRFLAFGHEGGDVTLFNLERMATRLADVELAWEGVTFQHPPQVIPLDALRRFAKRRSIDDQSLDIKELARLIGDPKSPFPIVEREFARVMARFRVAPTEAKAPFLARLDLLMQASANRWRPDQLETLLQGVNQAIESNDDSSPAFRIASSAIWHITADLYQYRIPVRMDDALKFYRAELNALESVRKQDPSRVPSFREFWCRQNLSSALAKSDLDAAIEHRLRSTEIHATDQAVASGRDMSAIHRELVDWLVKQKRFAEAEKSYQRWERIQPPVIDASGAETPAQIAQWLFSFGGIVDLVTQSGKHHSCKAVDQLPNEPFRITSIHLYACQPRDMPAASEFHRLRACKQTTYLNLSRHPAAGSELKDLIRHVAKMPKLNTLLLNGTNADLWTLDPLLPKEQIQFIMILGAPGADSEKLEDVRNTWPPKVIATPEEYATWSHVAFGARGKATVFTAAGEVQQFDQAADFPKRGFQLMALTPDPNKSLNQYAFDALLPQAKLLERLDLSGRKDVDSAFCEKLAKLKSLKNLDLRNSSIDEETLGKLKAALPDCLIVHD